jgi:hypothetical protein
MGSTITVEARELAMRHCEKFGKNARYTGGRAANPLSVREIHEFVCEAKRVIVQQEE